MADAFSSPSGDTRGIGAQTIDNDRQPCRDEDDPPRDDEGQDAHDEWQVGCSDALA